MSDLDLSFGAIPALPRSCAMRSAVLRLLKSEEEEEEEDVAPLEAGLLENP